MTRHPPERAVPRSAILAATCGGVLATALVLTTLLAAVNRHRHDDGGITAPAPAASYTTPPTTALARIHATLTDKAARCSPDPRPDDQQRLNRDADLILDFARRYPNAEFPADDETGHTLSPLFAARDDLTRCAPAAAARIDAALPAQLRQSPQPAG